jgi:hypothetical protein
MWSYVVVVDALPFDDRGIGLLDGSHYLVSFSHGSVEAFNPIVAHFALVAFIALLFALAKAF